MLSTRQYLRMLGKTKEGKETLKKLLAICTNLTETEYWLLTYAFIQQRMRENTCAKLNIGTTKYATMLNEALIKVEFTIRDLDKIRTL